MHDRFPSSDPLNNHLNRHEILPSQHASALRAYYWSIDRIMKQPVEQDALRGVVTRLLADHYDVSDEEAERLLDVSTVNSPLPSTYEDDDMRQMNKEQLLLLPLLELGSYVDQTYEPAASGEWYTQVAAAILERTRDTHSDECLQYGEKGCVDSAHCSWRIIAGVLTKQAADPNFDSIEYLVAPDRQQKMVMAKLVAARANGLERVNKHAIGDIASFYCLLANSRSNPTADTPS